jgi:hypothetical protein
MKLNQFHQRQEFIKIKASLFNLSLVFSVQFLLFLMITSLSFACDSSEIYYASIKSISCDKINQIDIQLVNEEPVLFNSAINYQSSNNQIHQPDPAEVFIIDGYYEVNIEDGGFYNFE